MTLERSAVPVLPFWGSRLLSRGLLVLPAVLLASSLALAGTLSAAPPAAAPLAREAFLQEAGRVIGTAVDREYAVGYALGVVRGEETFTAGFGETARGSGVKPDAKTLFQIGSITKTFVGVQLADLARRGLVSLDDPIELYLPVDVRAPAWGGRKITLGDLATHYSGLPGLAGDFVSSPEGVCGDAYTLERLWRWLDGFRLQRSPGERYEYSNVGLAILGHLLANVYGKSWEASCLDEICLPLGMADTRVALRPEQLRRVCQGHRPDLDPVRQEELGAMAPGGALLSTVDDLLLYGRAHLGLLPTRLLPAMQDALAARRSAGGPAMNVALCWFRVALPTGNVAFYEGGTLGFNSFLILDPEKKTGLVLLCNQDAPVNAAVALRLWNLLNGGAPEALALPEPAKRDREEMKAYAGRYLLEHADNERLENGDRTLAVELQGRGLKITVPGDFRTRLFPASGDAFFRKDVAGDKSAVRFHRGPDGTVASVTLFVEGAEKTLPRVQ